MLFNSFLFLLFFLIVAPLHFLVPQRRRWMLLLAASCYFYMAFIPAYILILFLSIAIDYAAGLLIERAQNRRRRKACLALSIVANVTLLAVFKYYNFFNYNLGWLAKSMGLPYSAPALSIILPIGLSFHTFQAMSYTFEVYYGRQRLIADLDQRGGVLSQVGVGRDHAGNRIAHEADFVLRDDFLVPDVRRVADDCVQGRERDRRMPAVAVRDRAERSAWSKSKKLRRAIRG